MTWVESRLPSKVTSAGGLGHGLELSLELSELRYRRLFETAQDGILILNGDTGAIIDVNPFLLDLLDYPFESIIGLQLWQIGLFEDITANKAAFARLQTDEYIRYENHPLQTKGGQVVSVEFVSNVYFVGPERVIQCNIRDISQRVAIEATASERVAAVETAGKAKDDVVAVLSHELRMPLTAISSMLDVIEFGQSITGHFPPKQAPPDFGKRTVELIRRNVETLVRLITELFDLTHFAKGRLQLNFANVAGHEAIKFVINNLESQRKAKQIKLDLRLFAQHDHIWADAAKVEHVLTNLISNALKFTSKNGTVSIVTRNEGGNRLVVDVSDTGIGISADALTRIFSPFEQEHPSIQSRYGGLGLGLSIARSFMGAHGGTLEVTSEGLNRGATFTARFQLEEAPSTSPPEPVTSYRAKSPPKILLVEEQDDSRRALAVQLTAQGYQVDAAPTLEAALKLVAQHDFDLLITDIGLPDGNGLDFYERIKLNSPNLQGIAVGRYNRPDDIADAKTAGFFSHLAKPVHFAELRHAIEACLPQAKAMALQRMRE